MAAMYIYVGTMADRDTVLAREIELWGALRSLTFNTVDLIAGYVEPTPQEKLLDIMSRRLAAKEDGLVFRDVINPAARAIKIYFPRVGGLERGRFFVLFNDILLGNMHFNLLWYNLTHRFFEQQIDARGLIYAGPVEDQVARLIASH
jgi:hypothetical protein